MRSTPFVVALVVWAGLGLASVGATQTVTGLTIHNVTVHEGAGVLTITGTGFGREAVVTVDGQPVPVLPGATARQVEVLAPAALLTTPGTYRLTVIDPVRHIGDAFVVASGVGGIVPGGVAAGTTPGPVTTAAPAAVGSPITAVASRSLNGPAPLFIEDSGSPFRTALGFQALTNNTSGLFNTAAGFQALLSNTTAHENTASGYRALRANTAGGGNTASGYQALGQNTTGGNNTASGASALHFNTTGVGNTASGYQALFLNTTGSYNTASGYVSLTSNTTGVNNTASGFASLNHNITGDNNTASGYQALNFNTTGDNNTASGYQALFFNSGSNNMASGSLALFSNGLGSNNTASGVEALYANTTGFLNTASGYQALRSNTTGIYNTASGTSALYSNITGRFNTATGLQALLGTTGEFNTALGAQAGSNATTGSYNLFVGADVTGTAADTNTIRIGLPYSGGVGQNQTFIAGIRDTALTGSVMPVYIDANGQLGTLTPTGGTPGLLPMAASSRALGDALDRLTTVTETVRVQQQQLADQRQQLREQQTTNADLRARLARLEQLLAPAAAGR